MKLSQFEIKTPQQISQRIASYYYDPHCRSAVELQATINNNRKVYRTLVNQHDIQKFRNWGTLIIAGDYDEAVFRKRLSKQAKKHGVNLVCFREVSLIDGKERIRFISSQSLEHATVRQMFCNCLEGNKIRLQLDVVSLERKKARGLFHFLSKDTVYGAASTLKIEGRRMFDVGKNWSKPTSILCQLTPEQVGWKLFYAMEKDADLAFRVSRGEFTSAQLADAAFLWKWYQGAERRNRAEKFEGDIVEKYLTDNGFFEQT